MTIDGMPRARLEIRQLAKHFGPQPVLRNIDFEVAPGTLVAILGASGSGKTTLLRLIAGFERPDAGEILLGGQRLNPLPPARRGIGYVAQEGALFPHLSVADNIVFGLDRAARKSGQRATELLALVGLPADYALKAPQHLSGGEQQRVALARALAPQPRLILLDEPFSALDAQLREETREAVAAALRATGATAILVTHDQGEAFSLGARIGVLRNGELRQMSTPQTLYRRPADAALAHFIGDAVFTRGVARNGTAESPLGRLNLAAGAPEGEVQLMIRPEQIKLGRDASAGVPARAGNVTFHGHDATVRLWLATAPDLAVTARMFSHELPEPGAEFWLRVEGEVVAYPAEDQHNSKG